ncbi:MAG: hypothetical protein IH988_04025 [Planctomycetes bacterium]|nr:hypothetical protein [Planctomycetota bacterium]
MKAQWTLPVCVGLAALVAFVASSPATPVPGGATIVGTWRLAVSHEFGDFFSLMVFDKRNTLTDNASLHAGTSLGSGVWEKIDGHDTYAGMFEAWNDDDFDGTFDTRAQIRLTIQVDDDTLTGTATVDIFTLDGTVLLASIPGFIVEGTRMTVIPE